MLAEYLLLVLGILLEGSREELVSDAQFTKTRKHKKPTVIATATTSSIVKTLIMTHVLGCSLTYFSCVFEYCSTIKSMCCMFTRAHAHVPLVLKKISCVIFFFTFLC